MSAVKAEIEKNDAIQLGVPGLGERLRSARVARDLDIARMSELIHLTVAMVDALEHDDYSEMPARVFVRGYIRNYARTVELPIDSVMAQFDALWPDQAAPVRISPSPRLPSDGQSNGVWHRAMTWLLVLVMLVLFLIWWQGYLDKFIGAWDPQIPRFTSGDTSGGLSPEPVPGAGLLRLTPPSAGQDDAAIMLPSDSALPAPQGTEIKPRANEADANAGNGAVGEMTGQGSLPGMPQPGTQVPVASLLPGEPPVAQQLVVEKIEAAPVSVVPVEPEPEGVRVLFSQDCWVDIRDSTRTFKMVGTMKRGTERELGGKPPYKVVLGNARGVEILVDGKPFNLASETVANVARFTLSP